MKIHLTCLDDSGLSIKRVYLNVSGPGIFIPDWNMNFDSDNKYSIKIESSYLYRTGDYQVNIYCENNISQVSSITKNFKVSELKMQLNKISNPVYIGDKVEIDVFVKKDEIKLSSGVNFSVKIGSYESFFNQTPPPVYDSERGWILKMDVPGSPGFYEATIVSQYDRMAVTYKTNIEVKQQLEFELIEMDKIWVVPGENLTITLRSIYKGVPLELSKNNLQIWINNINCEIVDITGNNGLYYVKIKTPNLSYGRYEIKARLNTPDLIKDIKDFVEYAFQVYGDISNSENKPINTYIEFRKENVKKGVSTDVKGHFSVLIPIGEYEVEFQFPKSRLIVNGVEIKEFIDPIRYEEIESDLNVEGIGVGGIFVYELAINFDEAYLEMKYDESKIRDEDRIVVYRCDNWNFAKKNCNSGWDEVSSRIDTVRNLVKINTTSPSTFLIGYKKKMFLNGNIDKETYFLNDILKITGMVEDEEEKVISDVKIRCKIEGSNIETSTKTDNNGIFSLEFQGPSKEGKYKIYLTAEKPPYEKVNKTLSVEIIKSKKLSITVPNNIKIKRGENLTAEILIANTGQTDFYDLSMTIEGFPDYYTIKDLKNGELELIRAGEMVTIPLFFEVPLDATLRSYTGTVKVKYDVSSYLEEKVILTILDSEKQEKIQMENKKITGKFAVPEVPKEVLMVFLFCITAIVISIIFSKRNKKNDLKNIFSEIKTQIRDDGKYKKIENEKEDKKIIFAG
ncbi:MAG: hypothetical protein QXY45_02735 [Candidatus Aenigmatarchaeota archaeon]